MGQQLCNNSQQTTNTQNLKKYLEDTEIPYDQEFCDNPSKNKLSQAFLNTEVIASWNLLKQKSLNLEQFDFIAKKINHRIFNDANVSCSQEKLVTTQDFKQNLFIDGFLNIIEKKKYLERPAKAYQNIQIDIGAFINLRTETIEEFYTFQQKIGEGSFGNVYRATDKKTKELRAIKALKKKGMNNAKKMNFIAEIDLLKKLDHPNIIKLYDLFCNQGNYYVVTQFCEGGCLQTYYNQQKNQISLQFTKIVMKQLLSVLAYLHNEGIVHRDLKLENIVFLKKQNKDYVKENRNTFEIKLIDFGTAIKVHRHQKNKSGLVGTLLYMAPEFKRGFFTEKCDIWSAGVVFYKLMLKEFPFKGRSQEQVLRQICNKQPNWKEIAKKIPKQPFQILKSMLDKNYLSRPNALMILKQNWIKQAHTARASRQARDSVTQTLTNYNRTNNFVSMIQSFISFKKITQESRQELSKIFLEIDKDNSGLIQISELVDFYHQKYPAISEEKIRVIIKNVDKNKSGKIDFNQFLTAVSNKSKLYERQSLKEAFCFFDKDRTGFISKKQIRDVLKGSDKREIQELFNNIDEDGDKQITFEQFENYLLKYNFK